MKRFVTVALLLPVALTLSLSRSGVGQVVVTPQPTAMPPTVQQALAALEQSIAAATAPKPKPAWLYTNVPAHLYWTYNVYARLDRQNSGWYAVNDSATAAGFTYSKNAYPVGPAGIHARSQNWLIGVPASSKCSVTWKGNATLNLLLYGGGSWQQTGPNSGVLTTPPTVGTYDAGGNPTTILWTDCSFSDPANPLDDLEIWLPGYGPGTAKQGQLFRDDYLASFSPFAGARFMGFLGTATSAEVNPADLVPYTSWDWTTRGAPQQAAIELWREIHARNPKFNLAWACCPVRSTTGTVAAIVQMWHDALPAGTEFDLELGNENWNWGGGFVGWPYINAVANGADGKTPNPKYDATTDGLTRAVRVQADLVRSMSVAARPIFADRPGDLRIVFGCQAGNSYWAAEGLRWEAATYSDHPFDVLADAPYFTWDSSNPALPFVPATGPLTLDECHCGVLLDFNIYVRVFEAMHTGIAAQYKLKHYNYEGGNSFNAVPFSTTGIGYLYCASPEIGKDYALYLSILHDSGVDAYFDFHHGPCDRWDQYGFWADVQNLDPTDPLGPCQKNYRWVELQRAATRWN